MQRIPSCLVLLLIILVASCDKYDSWTVSPSAKLNFSQDTVSFDTVFTNMSSPTRQLIVWNNNDDGVRIQHIHLAAGKESRFRVNVDGQYLYEGSGDDFEIRRQDSIFVKLEVTLPENVNTPNPHYEDDLVFTLESGVTQQVRLIANGLDVQILRGLTIAGDMTFTADKPYLIYDSLVVGEGSTLNIEAGVRLMFHDDVDLIVRGTLLARGTMQKPVIFRGDRLDNLFDYLPYDNTTNRWGGIHFMSSSHDNLMEQCDVHSGNYGVILDKCDTEKPQLLLTNSIIHNVGGDGLLIDQGNVEVVGTQISNTLGHTVNQRGGASLFVHCTIAQFYPFSGDRGDALHLSNLQDEVELPLHAAYFINCVITGYADDVIMGEMTTSDEYEAPYLFHNCLLRTVKSEDDPHFQNIIYDDDKELSAAAHFQLMDTYNFLYDFTPVETSSIRGAADLSYAQEFCPVDRRGTSRLQQGGADMGAYQYVTRDDTAHRSE